MDASKALLRTYTVVGEMSKGSQNNVMFKARKGKREFFVKFHMKMCPPNVPEMPLVRMGEDKAKVLRKHQNAVRRAEQLQIVFEEYYEYKKKLYATIRGKDKNNDTLNCPLEFWWERVNGNPVNGCKVCIEAEPWLLKSADVKASRGITAVCELPPDKRREIILSFAQNLAKLHSRGVVHSDIKPNNMVVSIEGGEYVGSFIDFDMSFFANEPPSPMLRKYIMGGTDEYNSPEKTVIEYQSDDPDIDISPIDYKADIFALGFSFFEYLTGEGDFPVEINGEKSRERLITSVFLNGGTLDLLFNDDYNDKLNDLEVAIICWCLDPDPQKRPTAEALYQVILNNDLSAVPLEYKRFNCHEPWNSEYVFNYPLFKELNIEVSRIDVPNQYIVKGRDGNVELDEEQLIEIGFLVKHSESVSRAESKPWVRDKIVYIPQKGVEITRGSAEGYYILTKNGINRVVNAEKLVSATLAEYTDPRKIKGRDIDKPWEEDLITFTPLAKGIIRARAVGKYIVGKGEPEILDAEELVSRGFAKRLPYDISKPFPSDLDMTVNETCEYIFKTRTGRKYVAVSNGVLYVGDKNQLANGGYVTVIGGRGESTASDNNVWPSDKIVIKQRTDGIVVEKARVPGKYQVVFPPPNARIRYRDAKGLIAEGYAEPLADPTLELLEEVSPSNALKLVLGIGQNVSSANDFIIAIDRYERKKKSLSMESVRAKELEERRMSEEQDRLRALEEEKARVKAVGVGEDKELVEERTARAKAFKEIDAIYRRERRKVYSFDEEAKARVIVEEKEFKDSAKSYRLAPFISLLEPNKRERRHRSRSAKRFFGGLGKLFLGLILTVLALVVVTIVIVLAISL